MRPTSGEAAADVGFRDGVSTHFDALGDAADGELGRWQPEVMDLDLIARDLGLLEEFRVGSATQRAFEAEGLAGFQAALDFVKQKFAGSEGESLWGERGETASDFVGVEETRDGIELAEVGFSKRGFTRTVGISQGGGGCYAFADFHSTVTLFAKFRGWSISQPRRRATW